MKKLSVLALTLFAVSAFATGPSGGGTTEVVITGVSEQTSTLTGVIVSNKVEGANNIGQQNLASNAGAIEIKGTSKQTVTATGGSIRNSVEGSDNVAGENLSSNVGNVTIAAGGKSTQTTTTSYADISNSVKGTHNLGTQNISSNNSCATCNKVSSSGGSGGGWGHE
ncbi:MAG: hypothetical protein RL761_1121 [Pseudomonadota bacterium]|jgi:hypothetical protein